MTPARAAIASGSRARPPVRLANTGPAGPASGAGRLAWAAASSDPPSVVSRPASAGTAARSEIASARPA